MSIAIRKYTYYIGIDCGVGYIKAKWQNWKDIPEPHSGIELLSDHWPTFDYDHN